MDLFLTVYPLFELLRLEGVCSTMHDTNSCIGGHLN
jgi:hypothetical protein